MDEVESLGGIKLMLTLTNCLADYGGMQQYVRWVTAGT
jgi:endo-1,4-beta-mannosidase